MIFCKLVEGAFSLVLPSEALKLSTRLKLLSEAPKLSTHLKLPSEEPKCS
uniref:Uncharacterized protein n=1 Tax=Rhizophora mucronata TaxID=61149 RepID=A0A2P2L4F3_RHIMU